MLSDRLKGVILRELALPEFPMDEKSVANQVPGWDSLSHVRVMAAIEKEYSIRLKTLEVLRLKNLGDLQALVDRKAAGK
jgi:acyl carrier protein